MHTENTRRDDGSEHVPTATPAQLGTAVITSRYERPRILSHSGEDILEELGPAQACYPFNSCGIAP